MLVAALLLAACGGNEDRPVLVLAASSLTDVFMQLADEFEQANPGVEVDLSFGGSSALARQIEEGAPADVFASADAGIAQALVQSRALASYDEFAANRLAMVVPAGNPGKVAGIEDLARDDLLVGLCAEGVPCGDLARRALDAAGVTASVDTNEADVRSLLTKLLGGDLDVGLVYATDVIAAGDAVEEIPLDADASSAYAIGVTAGAPQRADADRFLDFVLGPRGQAALEAAGFDPPPAP